MKSVFIISSRKFYSEVKDLIKKLRKKKIKASTVEWNRAKKDTAQSEKKALLKSFRKINQADIIYVYAKEGYVGKTVAMEISYAYAKGKTIVASERINELSAQALITCIVTSENIMRYSN